MGHEIPWVAQLYDLGGDNEILADLSALLLRQAELNGLSVFQRGVVYNQL
ncbi:hypothetical protein FB593_12026 [Rhizobium sp. SJZ105]|nr:hypothetical protein [Rhizobium sp. SJZ105]TWC76453.1 hypothetical protein FB593_12026 [Rhizobium sp. SJZ105]